MQRTPDQIMKDCQKVARALHREKPISVRELAEKTGLDRAIVNYSLDRLFVIRHGDTKSAAYTKEKDDVKPPLARPDVQAARKAARKAKRK